MRVGMFQEIGGPIVWPSGVEGSVLPGAAFPVGCPALLGDPVRPLGG